MSKTNKDINININPNNQKQNNNKGNQKRNNNKNNRRNRTRSRMRRRRRGGSYFNFSSQIAKIKRKEIWFEGSFEESQALATVSHRFDVNAGPSWFKTMASMYEKYKLVHVRIWLKFGGSKMTKGLYLLTFNSNLSAIAAQKTYAQLAAQKGSKQIAAASQTGVIDINGSSLTGYSTTLPTEGADESYAFNVIIAGTPIETVPYVVEIEYKVVFYNPTISD